MIFSKVLTYANRKGKKEKRDEVDKCGKLTGNATDMDVPSNATIKASTARVIKTSHVRREG